MESELITTKVLSSRDPFPSLYESSFLNSCAQRDVKNWSIRLWLLHRSKRI